MFNTGETTVGFSRWNPQAKIGDRQTRKPNPRARSRRQSSALPLPRAPAAGLALALLPRPRPRARPQPPRRRRYGARRGVSHRWEGALWPTGAELRCSNCNTRYVVLN